MKSMELAVNSTIFFCFCYTLANLNIGVLIKEAAFLLANPQTFVNSSAFTPYAQYL